MNINIFKKWPIASFFTKTEICTMKLAFSHLVEHFQTHVGNDRNFSSNRFCLLLKKGQQARQAHPLFFSIYCNRSKY